MDDLCFPHMTRAACPQGAACPAAHALGELTDPDRWVAFPSHRCVGLPFIAERHRQHPAFRHYHLPGLGLVLRLPNAAAAAALLGEYAAALGATGLLTLLALAPPPPTPPPPPLPPAKLPVPLPDPAAYEPSQAPSGPGVPTAAEEALPLTPAQQALHHSQQVVEILRRFSDHPNPARVGWIALETVWRIRERDFDEAALTYLRCQPPMQQQHILLTFAAIGLTAVQNPSAYLSCLIREHDTGPQVCIRFVAGVCRSHPCGYVHPEGTVGWGVLQQQWALTFRDFDYGALNYLSKKPPAVQDQILITFAGMNLRAVNNLSAYLSSVVQKFEVKDPHSAAAPRVPGRPATAAAATWAVDAASSASPFSPFGTLPFSAPTALAHVSAGGAAAAAWDPSLYIMKLLWPAPRTASPRPRTRHSPSRTIGVRIPPPRPHVL